MVQATVQHRHKVGTATRPDTDRTQKGNSTSSPFYDERYPVAARRRTLAWRRFRDGTWQVRILHGHDGIMALAMGCLNRFFEISAIITCNAITFVFHSSFSPLSTATWNHSARVSVSWLWISHCVCISINKNVVSVHARAMPILVRRDMTFDSMMCSSTLR